MAYYENRMQILLNNHVENSNNYESLNNAAELMETFIRNATEQHIFKTKICPKSKNWWSSELTELRKSMSSKNENSNMIQPN